MFAVMISISLVSQAPVTDDAAILKTVREQVGRILKSPGSAVYKVSGREGRPNYPTSDGFVGSVRFINTALAEEGYYTVNGTVDANNALGVSLRASWKAIAQDKTGTKVGCVLFTDSRGESTQIYASSEFAATFEAGLTKCLKMAFVDYAQHVFEVEQATKKLPYNNAKRQKQYWGELNDRAKRLTTAYEITEKELEVAIIIGLKAGWETKEKEHLEACRVMIRRKYKDTALAIRKYQSQVRMAQLNASVNAMTQTATAAGTQSNNGIQAFMQRHMAVGPLGR